MKPVLIAMGANARGRWGSPVAVLGRAVSELGRAGVRVTGCSAVYRTAPVGRTGQPDFVNAVLSSKTGLSPPALLRLLKRLERAAGRRRGPRNGPRPLDLDIIDYAGRVSGWHALGRTGGLVLPHPEAHRRAFVLEPLLDVAPQWLHPALRVRGRALLERLPRKEGDVGVDARFAATRGAG